MPQNAGSFKMPSIHTRQSDESWRFPMPVPVRLTYPSQSLPYLLLHYILRLSVYIDTRRL